MKKSKIIFCGLSHLSLNYGAVSAKFCDEIIFFDYEKKIKKFLNKDLIYKEPKLDNYLNKYKNKIKFISNLDSEYNDVLIVIAIDIKTKKNNQSDYSYIIKLLNKITLNSKLRKNPLVIMSQVQPTFTRAIQWPKHLLYYQVETLIFGQAIDRAENPERIIVGTHNGLKSINKIYLNYLKKHRCPLIFMKYEEAELSKMYINSYLVSDVVLTNILSTISKNLNLNWTRSIEALKLDKRIGKFAYLKPGLGISGGNLERDIVNLLKISKNLNIDSNLFKVFLEESKKRKNWIQDNINKYKKLKLINSRSKIGIIGLSYKENTNSLKNSPSLLILKYFQNNLIFCYDKNLYGTKVDNYDIKWANINELINKTNIIFIMHDYKIINKLQYKNNTNLIFDPYSFLNKKKIDKKIVYLNL